MDTEKGDLSREDGREVVKSHNAKRFFTLTKILLGCAILASVLVVMFGMGVLAARYTASKIHATTIPMGEKPVPQIAPMVRRQVDEDCDEEHASAADAVAATSAPAVSMDSRDPIVSENADGAVISIPISTLYSLHSPEVTTKTQTKTAVVTIPTPPVVTSVSYATIESSAEVCSVEVITETKSFFITITPSFPAPTPSTTSPTPGDATVTGGPGTVTDVQTEVSITSGLPDATVGGNPSTVTDVQKSFSITSGLPDATVPSNPETVTDVQKSFSITSGLPDATVPGNPATVTDVQKSFSLISSSITYPTIITITDLYPTISTTEAPISTVTAFVTISSTVIEGWTHFWSVTITTNQYPAPSTAFATSAADGEAATATSITPTSTFTKFVTETAGPTSISTTVVTIPGPPYPSANGTVSSYPSGTITSMPAPTTPIVISGGNKKPEPRGWGGTNGTTNLGCTIMLIALIMCLM
ncbi:Fc.00g111930.m01.CDS01 [Cosmosporella sp. VM-42]